MLLTPARIGAVEIRNRIVMPPMTTRLADQDGHVTDDAVNYYMARVRGGVGLITVEMASPTKAGRHRRHELGIYDDRFLPGLARLTAAIRAGGAKASIQLGHGGGHTRLDICGEAPLAPSAIPHPVFEITDETIIPKEMSAADIAFTIAGFAAAAARAEQAGFDCVEIHAAHGYLISQFVTPFENRRTDAYGGSLENRARFGLEVLRAVKAAVRIPVIYRVSVEDLFPARVAVCRGPAGRAVGGAGGRRRAPHRGRTLPLAALGRPHDPADDLSRCDVSRLCRGHQDGRRHARHRRRPARRSRCRGRGGRVRQGGFHRARAHADRRARLGGKTRPRRAGAALPRLQHLRRRDARRHATALRRQRRRRPGDAVRWWQRRRRANASRSSAPGRPGLTYASLAADGNRGDGVRARGGRRAARSATPARRRCSRTWSANQASFDRYIERMVAACSHKGVTFRYGVDVARAPGELASFDRIVIATGARYRFGLGPLPALLLDRGAGHWPGLAQHLQAAGVPQLVLPARPPRPPATTSAISRDPARRSR